MKTRPVLTQEDCLKICAAAEAEARRNKWTVAIAILDDGGRVAITLVRAVGWLSRGDLRERRGHAGPELETPTAQCIGPQRFRYCVVPLRAATEGHHLGHWSFGRALRSVREFLSPPWTGRGDGSSRTLLRLRASPDGEVVVRLAAMGPGETTARLTFDRGCVSSRTADLREGDVELGNTGLDVIRTAGPLEIASDGSAVAHVRPYEIGTWLVRLR